MVFGEWPGNALWLIAEDAPGPALKSRLLAADAE
jgi:hypothetical protein